MLESNVKISNSLQLNVQRNFIWLYIWQVRSQCEAYNSNHMLTIFQHQLLIGLSG